MALGLDRVGIKGREFRRLEWLQNVLLARHDQTVRRQFERIHLLIAGAGTTDDDGRLKEFVSGGAPLAQGTYRLRFDVSEYFTRTQRETFFPEVAVVFRIGAADEHYHVPVLLSPFGYSTYRGS